MRLILILSLLFFNLIASATTYYVSSSGNDGANGVTESTAWKTIDKVNSSFSLMKPGDKILFRRGDVFYGTLKIISSGIAGNPIFIGAYGTGNKPVITGFKTLTGWTNTGGGIYSKYINCESEPAMVTIDGTQYGMGRYPNDGWLKYESFTTNISITDNELGSAVIWTGSEAVIKKNPYTIERCLITSHIGNKLTYSSLETKSTTATNNYGYFIQNDKRTLDKFGEWYYNKNTSIFYMYLGTSSPDLHKISVSSINNLVVIQGRDYITFDNLSFQGSAMSSIYLAGTTKITIQNCDIIFSGLGAIESRLPTSSYLNLINNHINYSNGTAILSDGNNAIIKDNLIENTGIIIGSSTGDLRYCTGIHLYSSKNTLIQNNSIINTGGNGIFPNDDNVKILNNYLDNFCINKVDGGGIYVSMAGNIFTGLEIQNNIIINGIGTIEGTSLLPTSWTGVEGIFLDAPSSQILVKNNTVASCNSGIKIHEAHDNILEGNTLFNNRWGYEIVYYGSFPNDPIRNITMNNNIVVAKDSDQLVLFHYSSKDDLKLLGTADNNYYLRPVDDDAVFSTREPSTGRVTRNLSEWKEYMGQDENSKKSPISLTNSSQIKFEYNSSKNNKVVSLIKPMIDVFGTKYSSSITLSPFTSTVLFEDPAPTPSIGPLYVSSTVQDINPSMVTMSYNADLAAIKPAPSAFTVIVNGVNRSIDSVAVSDNNVLLYLAIPIAYGTVVTVSYTKPEINPLQNESGEQVSSISNKSVENTISSTPVLLKACVENESPSTIQMTYNWELAKDFVPSPSAFSVMVNSIQRTIKSVEISGSLVLLSLDNNVAYGTIVTISYIKPAVNPLQALSGREVKSFDPQPVQNNVKSSISPAPIFQNAIIEADDPFTVVMNYNTTLANVNPAPSAFTIVVNGVYRPVKYVKVLGSQVLLNLEIDVAYGTVVSLSYTNPDNNSLQTTSGGIAADLTDQPVTNNVSPVPLFLNASIKDISPTVVAITYNRILADIVPSSSAFSVEVNGIKRTVSTVTVSDYIVYLTLQNPVASGNVVTVSYIKPVTNPIQVISGREAVSIYNKPVLNKVTSVSVSPVLENALIESDNPYSVVMNYNMNLAYITPDPSAFTVIVNGVYRNIKSVSISGTKVSLNLELDVPYGTIVTVSYNISASNPLQSTSGGLAASFINQPVENNVGPEPLFLSAFVEDATPTLVEMIYNRTLANIIPSFSAFTVIVNGVTRTINSVSINGTKVLLNLAIPIAYGTIVTVSYNKPTTNPLQVLSGRQAFSISNKPVLNNIRSSSSESKGFETTKNKTNDTTAFSSDPAMMNLNNSLSEEIILYPNPSKGQFTIDFAPEFKEERSEISIINMSGKFMYKGFIEQNTKSSTFNFPKFKPGLYVLIIKVNETVIRKTFLINK